MSMCYVQAITWKNTKTKFCGNIHEGKESKNGLAFKWETWTEKFTLINKINKKKFKLIMEEILFSMLDDDLYISDFKEHQS